MFGQWKPFYISDKMKVLRVLDLEGTNDLQNHHLQPIWKLLHLKYLSLRGCRDIFSLPDSLGNLKQLQTLDIFGTPTIKMPHAIIKLRKLQSIHAENNDNIKNLPKLMQNKLYSCIVIMIMFCFGSCIFEVFRCATGDRSKHF